MRFYAYATPSFFRRLIAILAYGTESSNVQIWWAGHSHSRGSRRNEHKYYNDEQIAEYDSALQAVLKVGYNMLTYGSNGMDVVVECLTMLENDPHFNAGKGAVFNDQGEVELDASVMDGSTKMAGAVAGLKHIKNPAKLAQAVMEETSHVLLIGQGAEEFARLRITSLWITNTF